MATPEFRKGNCPSKWLAKNARSSAILNQVPLPPPSPRSIPKPFSNHPPNFSRIFHQPGTGLESESVYYWEQALIDHFFSMVSTPWFMPSCPKTDPMPKVRHNPGELNSIAGRAEWIDVFVTGCQPGAGLLKLRDVCLNRLRFLFPGFWSFRLNKNGKEKVSSVQFAQELPRQKAVVNTLYL